MEIPDKHADEVAAPLTDGSRDIDNAGPLATPSLSLATTMVRDQAALCPAAVALTDEDGHGLTYRDLVASIDRVGKGLRVLGAAPGAIVAVALGRSVDAIVAMLAVMDAGCVYMPAEAGAPTLRLDAMLEQSRARMVLVDDATRGTSAVGLARVTLGDLGAAADAGGTRDADVPRGQDLAYVVHTSGSTGIAKGVAMSHDGLARVVRWQIADGDGGLTTLQFTQLGFDVVFQEVFSTLCTGGRLVVVAEATRRDPSALLAALDRHGIERIFLPYVALQRLASAAVRRKGAPVSLRHVVTAGERLIVTPEIAAFFAMLPRCRLDNHYGPSETHLATRHRLQGPSSSWPNLPPIGSAIDGITLAVLDERREPVPDGAVGELHIGGPALARGYLNRDELTAERFRPDPSSPTGGRVYATGDLVRVDGDGLVHFVGRADDQIKVRGYRVEPAEVEAALLAYPGVAQAFVAKRTLAAGIDALVAFLVVDGAPPRVMALLAHLQGRLPDYMVPSRFVVLDDVPLTSTGKADLGALKGLAAAEPDVSDGLADAIRAIWIRVLGHDEFGSDDDFFDVGGDSLLATWVVLELSELVGAEVDLSILLENGTIDGLLRGLEKLSMSGTRQRHPSEIVTLKAGPSQRSLLLVHPLGGELLAYRALARELTAPLRVLGLRWDAASDDRGGPVTIETMATAHLEQIRLAQPRGPYLLAGWSFGGVLALDIAHRLMGAGERVDFVGLIDANPVLDPTTGRPTRDSPLADRLLGLLDEIDAPSADPTGGLSGLRADPELSALIGGSIPAGVTGSHLRRYLSAARDGILAAMAHDVPRFPGTVDLFQPRDAPAERQAALLRELEGIVAGPVRAVAVPGDHHSMLLPPQVGDLARAIDRAVAAPTIPQHQPQEI